VARSDWPGAAGFSSRAVLTPYFVGCDAWGFSLWAHNACTAEEVQEAYGITKKGQAQHVANLLNKMQSTDNSVQFFNYLKRLGVDAYGTDKATAFTNQHFWPPNNGFTQPPVPKTLPEGTKISRSGGKQNEETGEFGDGGRFAAAETTPLEKRALPESSTTNAPFSVYEVTQPIEVGAGRASPWFGQPGNGVQYQLPKSISALLADRTIRLVSRK
jgi:hypothetical protein